MATSPNYGWLEPDNTDLVKNGALAIRTLGNAIDTTMATMVPKSIVDAKGDLIAGTAADTAARLAVGANDLVLMAASGEATGLKWGGAWAAYSPTVSNVTLGNGTLSARYLQMGKTVFLEILLTLGSTSAVTGTPTFTMPASPKFSAYTVTGVAGLGDYGVANYAAIPVMYGNAAIYISATNTNGAFANENAAINATTPFTWTTNDYISLRATYEVA